MRNHCEHCYEESAGNEIMLENGAYAELCDACHDDYFYRMVGKGAEAFYHWADQNYTNALDMTSQLFDSNETEDLFGEDSKELITMFTYGILKYPRNIKQEGGIDIIQNSTIKGHKMYSTGSFPITHQTGNENDKVYGTLFKVPKHVVLYNYDYVEGYDPRRPKESNMYNREVVEVETPSGEIIEANMYMANPSYFRGWYGEQYNIPTGNFDDMPKYVKSRRYTR